MKGDEQTATMTIEYVDPQPADPWTGGNTPMWFPECRFSDGSIGSGIAFSAKGAEEVIAALQALVDVPTEFVLVDNDTYNGKQKWKLKSYPGKPATGGGGGAGPKVGGGMSHVHAGTLAAASVVGPILAANDPSALQSPELVAAHVQEVADILIEWLFSRRGGQAAEDSTGGGSPNGEAAVEQAVAPAPTPPADVLTLAQLTQLRKLGAAKGLGTNEEIAKAAGVDVLGGLTSEDADLLIEAWSA